MFTQEGIKFRCPTCHAHLISKTGAGACPMCADRLRTSTSSSDAHRQKRADREWEMAGLARQDGDRKAEHTDRARAITRGEV